MEKDEICLISGRFDRVHCGHIRTIQLLGQRFKKVIIVVLNYAEQKYSVNYRAQILRELLENSKGEYEVNINNYHFARISIEELMKYQFDVYAAGNMEVLKHIENILLNSIPVSGGVHKQRVIWVDRPYDYEASTDRLGQVIKEMT